MTTPPGAKSEQAWLEQVRTLMLHGDYVAAEKTVSLALEALPDSFELRRILAGIYGQTRRETQAEFTLRQLLIERSDDAGTAFALAKILIGQCRSATGASVMRTFFEHSPGDPELAIRAIELLDDSNHKSDAAAIAAQAINRTPGDPRLHAYFGMLAAQLGEFEHARIHYLYAFEHAPAACEWHIPYGLASIQRYGDATHPDFARFRDCLKRSDLTDKARSTLLFALAKAYDDVGDFEQAARYSRQANALAHALTQWSRKQWRRAVDARLNAAPAGPVLEPIAEFIPVFIVGVPRSGTTLTAELLARRPRVCNRGESPWLARLAEQPELAGNPDRTALQRAADCYVAELRQDDTQTIRWFIDKQPLNFRYVDLALALFPNAHFIYCRRSARDNALSLWLQSFLEDVQGYAYDFSDIAYVMRDCERLMSHWQARYPGAIQTVRYDQLVSAPERVISDLAAWLGMPTYAAPPPTVNTSKSISTASLWQARQPVYGTSLGRWKAYAICLPELLRFAGDQAETSLRQRPARGNNR